MVSKCIFFLCTVWIYLDSFPVGANVLHSSWIYLSLLYFIMPIWEEQHSGPSILPVWPAPECTGQLSAILAMQICLCGFFLRWAWCCWVVGGQTQRSRGNELVSINVTLKSSIVQTNPGLRGHSPLNPTPQRYWSGYHLVFTLTKQGAQMWLMNIFLQGL